MTKTITLSMDNDLTVSSRIIGSGVEVIVLDNVKGIEILMLPGEAYDLADRLMSLVVMLGIRARQVKKPDRRQGKRRLADKGYKTR